MNTHGFQSRWVMGLATLLSGVLVSGCGDPILGFDVAPAGPRTTLVTPEVNAVGVPINTQSVTATISEPIAAITDDSFTVTCVTPCVSPEGVVSLDAGGTTAQFTFAQGTLLAPSTTYTATISGIVALASGLTIAEPFVWNFTTAAGPDVTRPRVTVTVPATSDPGPTLDVAINTAITAVFSEEIAAATLDETSFTLSCADPCVAPEGVVSYAAGSMTAIFTPATGLDPDTTYTATLTVAVEDLAGNALVGNQAPLPDAGNYVFRFTTAAAADITAPTVLNTNPADGAVGVCVNRTLSVTFSEPMDPMTINDVTLTLSESDDVNATVNGVVSYDALTGIAGFSPNDDLIGPPATEYRWLIAGGDEGVTDLAGNPLATDVEVRFTTNGSVCAVAPYLGILSTFGSFSGSGALTNDGLESVINGDTGIFAASTSVTGLRDSDGNVYTVTGDNDGMVNGLIYTLTAPPGLEDGAAVAAAMAAAGVAFASVSPAALPGGIDMSDLMQCPSCGGAGDGADGLAGRTLPPGVYQSTTGTYDLGGPARSTEPLTLDAGGDADAVWVFQTADGIGTLNVGLTGPATPLVPIEVQLINGAQAKNVFWYAPAGAVVGTGSQLVGTLLADAVITFSTTGGSPPTAVLTTLEGRAISLTGGVTMTNTVINVPTP